MLCQAEPLGGLLQSLYTLLLKAAECQMQTDTAVQLSDRQIQHPVPESVHIEHKQVKCSCYSTACTPSTSAGFELLMLHYLPVSALHTLLLLAGGLPDKLFRGFCVA